MPAELETLYDQGRYVTAHAAAGARFGPLASWHGGVAALLFAGRLADSVGGERQGRVLTVRAWRRRSTDPAATPADHAKAALLHGFHVFDQRGPLAARAWLRRRTVETALVGADAATRAKVHCLHARIAAAYRDADAAESRWQDAQALAPTQPWIWCERAALLVALDRYPEALEAARESLRLRPWYRPAVQQTAHVLTLLGGDDEAVALLTDALDPAHGSLESGAVAGQLATVYAALQRPADVLRTLAQFEALSPLLEERGRRLLAARRGEARLMLGDLPGAARIAETLAPKSVFHARTAARLRDPEHQTARRLTLAVPFVRQLEKACAPATLAALSRFWGRSVDQANITREIWYGGTLDHRERLWAETHGWVAREFRADWTSTVAVLDLGVPFALVTTGINTGHLQAVIGYDARRRTLIIRDPYARDQAEPLADEFLAGHAFGGPRALALVPAHRADLIAKLRALDLPEASLHDEVYRLRGALARHDRPAARRALDALESLAPGARLTLLARRELATYDGDDLALLGAVEALLALFPGESRLRLEKLYALRRLARSHEARTWLEACVADPAQSEPNLWRELAVELAGDARQRSRARQWLGRALFYEPVEPPHVHALAKLRWQERDFEEGAALYRLAACAASTREDFWREFFTAIRQVRTGDEALRLLEARLPRLGDHSVQPAQTLCWAYRERHDPLSAADVLAAAFAARPDDGELLLFAATAHAQDGEHERAAVALAAAQGKVSAGAFDRAAALICSLRGDPAAALTHWRAVLAREPLDVAAHRAAAQSIAESDARGPIAAREALDAVVQQFPQAIPLHELRVQETIRDPGRGSRDHVAAVDALLEVCPTHVWALRERALGWLAQGDPAAALRVLAEAEILDPLAPATQALRGRAFLLQGKREGARASLRCALTLDVDLPGAAAALLEACATPLKKRAELVFLHGQLIRQPGGQGDGIAAYRTAAHPHLTEQELQGRLDDVLSARPDLWQAWSAVVRQHVEANRIDEAHAHAAPATARFPLSPPTWMDLAGIEKMRGNVGAQIDALQQALRLRAGWGEPSRQLADVFCQQGRIPEARAVLVRAIAAAPHDAANHCALAETYWREDAKVQGRRAVEILEEALARDPDHDPGWGLLDQYATQLGLGARPESLARRLVTLRPGEARSWLRLAQTLPGESGPALDERLAALDRALSLDPREDAAHELRAILLAEAGRFEEALAACRPAVYATGTRPIALEGRAAWVWATRGDLPGAREKMRSLLKHQPGYVWGWQLLADWAEVTGDTEEALAAAERLSALAPHDATSRVYLAAARAPFVLDDAMSDDPTAVERARQMNADSAGGFDADRPAFVYLRALTRHVLAVRSAVGRRQKRLVHRIARAQLAAERKEAAAVLRGSLSLRLLDLRARQRMARDAGAWGASLGWWWRAVVSTR